MGVLRYTPEIFWSMALADFLVAVRGYVESKGGAGASGPPMTKERISELHNEYPDVPNTRRAAS